MADEPMSTKRSGPARVILVDDHDLAREGLRSILAREPNLEIVGEATTGREAVALCRRLQPDLVLMDVRMPDLDGLAATREIKAENPRISVIIVTMHSDQEYLLEALKAGAAGYVLKDASKREVTSAVRQVLRGESLLPPDLAAQLLRRLVGSPTPADQSPPAVLTPREHDVLAWLVEGRTNKEIARELSVSPGTVKGHVEHIIRKLDVSDRTQAAVRAIEFGLVARTPPR